MSFQASSQRQHLLAASHCEPAASLRVGLPKGQHIVCEALRGGVQAWATPQLHSEGSTFLKHSQLVSKRKVAQGTDIKQPTKGLLDLRALFCGAHTSGFPFYIANSETV